MEAEVEGVCTPPQVRRALHQGAAVPVGEMAMAPMAPLIEGEAVVGAPAEEVKPLPVDPAEAGSSSFGT